MSLSGVPTVEMSKATLGAIIGVVRAVREGRLALEALDEVADALLLRLDPWPSVPGPTVGEEARDHA